MLNILTFTSIFNFLVPYPCSYWEARYKRAALIRWHQIYSSKQLVAHVVHLSAFEDLSIFPQSSVKMSTLSERVDFWPFRTTAEQLPTSREGGRPMSIVAHSKELVILFQLRCSATELDKERRFHWSVSDHLAQISKSFCRLPVEEKLNDLR